MLIPYTIYNKKWFAANSIPLQDSPWAAVLTRLGDKSLLILTDASSILDLDHSRLLSRKRFLWKPKEIATDDGITRQFKQLLATSETHLFCHVSDGELYAGQTRVGAIAYSNDTSIEVSLTLFEPLPKDIWLCLGGYSGWMVTIDDTESYVVQNAQDIDALVSRIRSGDDVQISVTRFEDDVYSVYLSQSQGVALYQDEYHRSFVSKSDNNLESREVVVFQYEDEGQNFEFSECYVVDREVAVSMLTDYLKTGLPSDMIPFQSFDD